MNYRYSICICIFLISLSSIEHIFRWIVCHIKKIVELTFQYVIIYNKTIRNAFSQIQDRLTQLSGIYVK